MSDTNAVLTLESFLLSQNDHHEYELITETFKSTLESHELTAVNNFQDLVSIEHRIITQGIGLKDVAAIETVAPGTLSHVMPIDGFSYTPSMQNVEYALERINLAKLSALVAAGGVVVRFAKWIVDYVKKRIQQFRDKRALKAAQQLNESLKEFRSNADNKNKANGLSKDTTQIPRPGGGSHNSQIKSYEDPQQRLFKEVWVERFGVSSGSYGSYIRCKSVKELTRMLGDAEMQGPSIFVNAPNVDINILLEFIKQSTDMMSDLNDMHKNILRSFDGIVAGNDDQVLVGDFQPLLSPLRTLATNMTSINIHELINDSVSRLHRWNRTTQMRGSLLLSKPEIIPKHIEDMVREFDGATIINTMQRYANEYSKTSKDIELKLERVRKSTGPESQSSWIDDLAKYNKTMDDMVSLYRLAILTYGNTIDYLTSFSTAINQFMEH